ncbi:MAG: DUF359 domain-containing protein [Thermoplasmatales archaeon]|nr:MAG: DUF359 domain-containing protein [Thermoplasmatales archaeon]
MLVLPEDLRKKLKEPLGNLVDEQGLLRLLQNEKKIVTVGDLVTFTLLKNGIEPILCIVDYVLERKECSSGMKDKIQRFGKKHVQVKNPPGTITDELWNAIGYAYKSLKDGPFRIEVDGEEDLAALPAIYLAPRDATIIYGLLNKGVVVVKATEAQKSKVKEILDKM